MAILDLIKYDAASDEEIVSKFMTEREDEIRIGSQLIVNQSQEAVFVKGGQALDVFGPGTHTLSTGNLPFLRQIVNFPFGRKTPFTAEVWFVNKTAKRDLRWGTMEPVSVVDPQYGYPISVRARGKWGLRIRDTRSFIAQIVGSQMGADSDKIHRYFIGEIVQRLSEALARLFVDQSISIFQAVTRLGELSRTTSDAISKEFERFGIEIVNFNVEYVTIPDDEKKKIQEVLAKKMEIEQISKAQVGQAYVTMRTFDTLEKAAGNTGGAAGALLAGGLGVGVGVGAGVPLGRQMGNAMNASPQQETPAEPQPSAADPVAKLKKLKEMMDAGLITAQEYDAKKQAILSAM